MPKRQKPPAADDDRILTDKRAGSMVSEASIGARITAARERRGLNKTQLAKAIGKKYRAVHSWETGEKLPERDSIKLVAEALAVTIEELLGVAEGQDPPFDSWRDFAASEIGQTMTAGERRMLQSLAWPPGREPTMSGYVGMLLALRGGTRERVN